MIKIYIFEDALPVRLKKDVRVNPKSKHCVKMVLVLEQEGGRRRRKRSC